MKHYGESGGLIGGFFVRSRCFKEEERKKGS